MPDRAVQKHIEGDLALLTSEEKLLSALALDLLKPATHHEAHTLYLVHTGPGIGKILSLGRRYAIHDLARLPRGQDFASSCRLVPCAKESAGKRLGTSGKNIGKAHQKWAFSEAATLLLRHHEPGPK